MTTETPEPTYDYAAAKRRAEYVKGLRDLADFFEKNPQLPHPACNTVNIMVNDKEQLAAFAKVGTWEKVYSDTWFMLRRQFGEDLTLDVNIFRSSVCRAVEVGEKHVPAQPAQPARIEKVYEWVCDDASLLGARTQPTTPETIDDEIPF